MNITSIKRALLSVYDKTGLVAFAKSLVAEGVELLSTGGTSQALKLANIPHRLVEDLTGFPEMMEGRVKTLHPTIYAGILGKRDKHLAEAKEHHIEWIDLVVVNFYPFNQKMHDGELTSEQMIEYIDIGGPTLVRAAAKNHAWTTVVVDPTDYDKVVKLLKNEQGLSLLLRQQLAAKAFLHTSSYDTAICAYLHKATEEPLMLELDNPTLNHFINLRYGENPHQQAFAVQYAPKRGILGAKQYQGKTLSFNNILDADRAFECVSDFNQPTVVIIKHGNPCGVASHMSLLRAYQLAYEADAMSAFGGIVALNEVCTGEVAAQIVTSFFEVILAPHYTDEALLIFKQKPNLRILELPKEEKELLEMKYVDGGVLIQEKDTLLLRANDLTVVTEKVPTASQIESLLFSWQVIKHIKSNAILLAKEFKTVGIGAGQVSRIDAVSLAIQKAGSGGRESVLASDAFFPFRDSIDEIAKHGISAIIQPGGSVRDEEVITACNENNIAMVFTGKRCFKH